MNFKLNPFSQFTLNPAVAHLANINLAISTSQKARMLSTILTMFPMKKLVFSGVCVKSQHIADFWCAASRYIRVYIYTHLS